MTQYFINCKTQADVKRLYRELAKSMHPDHGGTQEQMIELTRQYEAWKPNGSPFTKVNDTVYRQKSFNEDSGRMEDFGDPSWKPNAFDQAEWVAELQRKEHARQEKERLKRDRQMENEKIKELKSELYNLYFKFNNLKDENNALKYVNDTIKKSLNGEIKVLESKVLLYDSINTELQLKIQSLTDELSYLKEMEEKFTNINDKWKNKTLFSRLLSAFTGDLR